MNIKELLHIENFVLRLDVIEVFRRAPGSTVAFVFIS